jgi:hypothetical protein
MSRYAYWCGCDAYATSASPVAEITCDLCGGRMRRRSTHPFIGNAYIGAAVIPRPDDIDADGYWALAMYLIDHGDT